MKTKRLFAIPLVALCAVALIAADGEKKTKREKRAARRPVYVTQDQLILVKHFSTENTTVVGDHQKNADRVAKKKVRVPPLLTEKIIEQMQLHGYNVAAHSPESESEEAIVLDGEFLIMDNGSSAARYLVGFGAGQVSMLVRTWLYRPGDPSARLAVTELRGSSKIRFGMGNYEDPTTNVLARKMYRHLTGSKKKR